MTGDPTDGAVATGLIDSHCHLQLLPRPEREQALDEARSRGVTGFLVPAIRLDEADEILALCQGHPDVWCALGVHPHEASSWRPGDAQRLERLLAEPQVVAVGECGLDFHYDRSPRPVQVAALREQWEVALAAERPVIVHNRESNEEMSTLVGSPEFAGLAGVFHSFAGGRQMATDLLSLGHYLGLSGMVTFPRADNVREVIPIVPRDRYLVETDTPYLAPVPHRGRPNRPAYVVEVASRMATELGTTFETIAHETTHNFLTLFPMAVPGMQFCSSRP